MSFGLRQQCNKRDKILLIEVTCATRRDYPTLILMLILISIGLKIHQIIDSLLLNQATSLSSRLPSLISFTVSAWAHRHGSTSQHRHWRVCPLTAHLRGAVRPATSPTEDTHRLVAASLMLAPAKWLQEARRTCDGWQSHGQKQAPGTVFVLREEPCRLGTSISLHPSQSLADIDRGTVLVTSYGQCSPVSIECDSGVACFTHSTRTVPASTAIPVHVALCHSSGSLHHADKSQGTASRLSVRPCSVQTERHMHDVSPQQTSQVEALQSLRCLHCHVRPPLSVDQQLRRKRQLPVLLSLATLTWDPRVLRRVPQLLDPSPTSADEP